MTETHKAAVEALEKLAGMMPDKPTAITFDRGWEIIDCVQDDVLQHIPEIIRTLKQPSSVEVTVEELNEEICSKMHELIFQDGINADIYSILKKYEGRIIRAAATDGVK